MADIASARPRNVGSVPRRIKIIPEQYDVPSWAHPSYRYYFQDWALLRDAAEGERAVKDEPERYVPPFKAMHDDEYRAYVNRATYYNFTQRTIRALAGRLLRKRAKLNGLTDQARTRLKTVGDFDAPWEAQAAETAQEIIHMGRVGVLVDMPAEITNVPDPYFAIYSAENIIDWEFVTTRLDGRSRTRLTKVVLREYRRVNNTGVSGVPIGSLADNYVPEYRVLRINDQGDYTVQMYRAPDNVKDFNLEAQYAQAEITTLVRGQPLKEIPFYIFGPQRGGPNVEPSPVLDVARLNISHFRSYAHLEQGRYYTGFPIYYSESPDTEAVYEIGPNRVWNIPMGGKAGMIEFNGTGLKSLENALQEKEGQAAALGGRMIGVGSEAVSQSDNQVAFKEANERAMLLHVSNQLDIGWTKLLNWWYRMWALDRAEIVVEFPRDFLIDPIGAREFRAVHAMYKDGVIPIEVLYEYFAKYELIADTTSQEEFIAMLENPASFPAQPDAGARRRGYPNRQSELDAEQQAAALASAEKVAKSGATDPDPRNGGSDNSTT